MVRHQSKVSTSQILRQAWPDDALFPEEVRNHMRRLRKILDVLAIPAELVHKTGQGYSLVFRGWWRAEGAGIRGRATG